MANLIAWYPKIIGHFFLKQTLTSRPFNQYNGWVIENNHLVYVCIVYLVYSLDLNWKYIYFPGRACEEDRDFCHRASRRPCWVGQKCWTLLDFPNFLMWSSRTMQISIGLKLLSISPVLQSSFDAYSVGTLKSEEIRINRNELEYQSTPYVE